MVTEYGMSSLGPVQYEQQSGDVFLGRDYLKEKNFSDQVALETRLIIEECYAKAKKVISDNLDLLKNIAEYLLKVETLTKSDIDEIESTGHLKRYDDMIAAKTEHKDNSKEELEDKTAETSSLLNDGLPSILDEKSENETR